MGRREILLALLLIPAAGLATGALQDDFESPPIRYSASAPDDPISRLQKRLDSGQATLTHGPRGYLDSVLAALRIPVASQTLVFSKTSFQRDLISPQTPRALYFNDSTYVGWVSGGGVMEISTTDPRLGGVFYTLSQDKRAKPRFTRQTHECLQCHASSLTRGVPGHIVRSVYPDSRGFPILPAGSFITTHESPLKERWGGWYVTGAHGEQEHLGNQVFHSAAQAQQPDYSLGANLMDLRSRANLAGYASRHSDIVALMVLEHQIHVHNLIARAGFEARRALHYDALLNKELGRPEGHRSESFHSRIRSVGEPLVKALFFSGEAALTDRIKGTSGFAGWFQSQGPFDLRGRSLRRFDLERRMFRYPLSYLVYSEAFRKLPEPVAQYCRTRIREVLTNEDRTPAFAHLSDADRAALREIVSETLPGYLDATASAEAAGKRERP